MCSSSGVAPKATQLLLGSDALEGIQKASDITEEQRDFKVRDRGESPQGSRSDPAGATAGEPET